MDGWESLYANLAKNAPALAAANTTPKRYSNQIEQRKRLAPPALMIAESDTEGSDSDDEVELEEDELFEVLQGRNRHDENRSRKYANATFLSPPKPYLHRNPNQEGRAERQRLRKYESQQMQRTASPPSDRYSNHNPLPRSASSPTVSAIKVTSPPSSPPTNPSTPKPRKARPTPLELAPNPRRAFTPVDPTPLSPYPSSILSLYSSPQQLSPNSRTLSLPTYTFQSTDFPSPGKSRSSNPLPISALFSSSSKSSSKSSSTSNSSPRTSSGSSASSRTSMSSIRELFCPMPTPPTPTAILAAKKDRIYNTLTSYDLARRSSRDVSYR